MTTTVRTRCLLFPTLCLLLSTIVAAFPYDDACRSETCSTCVVRSALSSAVGHETFVLPINDRPLSLIVVEGTEPLRSAVFTFDITRRGPPPREGSFRTHL